jgi:tRNA A37 threonylcarbamoyladenosine modification protein TsaB
MTHDEAYKISEEAMTCFTQATAKLGQMRTMPTWTPEYDELDVETDALIARGQKLYARYLAWTKAQDKVTEATAAARQGAEQLGEHIVTHWRQPDPAERELQARIAGALADPASMPPAELAEFESIVGRPGAQFDNRA